MKKERNPPMITIANRFSLVWSVLGLGIILGAAGTYLFFQDDIQKNGNPRLLIFGLWSVVGFMLWLVPPVVFDAIGRFLDSRKRKKSEPVSTGQPM
jgi:hypothetical protein